MYRFLFSFLFFYFSINSLQAVVVEQVVATVEGRMVLDSDISSFKRRLSQKSLINENLVQLEGVNSQSSRKELLNFLISQKTILADSIKNLNGKDIDSVADKEINTLAKQNNITYSQLKKEITSRGIKFSEYKSFIGESSLIRSSIERNVISKVRPSEEDFVSYLKLNNIKGITSSHSYDLDQIFISKSKPNAQKSAQQINETNFKGFFSQSNKMGYDGIKLGDLQESELSPLHQKFLKDTGIGKVTSVIEEPTGYRIFYVNNKTNKFNIPNTQKVRSLQKDFYDQLIKKEYVLWINALKKSYFIRINT